MLKGGMNQVEIAAALGRSKQFVSLYAAYGDMPAYLKAALPFAPIRLLYDLHRTARDYPAEVEAYVASWGDAGATLAAGSRFIAELKQTHPAPAPPRAPVAQPLAPTDRDPVRSGLTDKPSAPIRSRLPVLVDGFPAWLPLAPLVTVIFEDGHEREVAASSIGPIGERGEALPTTDPPPPRS
jgi:ParB family chromosome partitioning protein